MPLKLGYYMFTAPSKYNPMGLESQRSPHFKEIEEYIQHMKDLPQLRFLPHPGTWYFQLLPKILQNLALVGIFQNYSPS